MHLIGFSLGEVVSLLQFILKGLFSGAHTASLIAKKFTEWFDEKVGRLTGQGSSCSVALQTFNCPMLIGKWF